MTRVVLRIVFEDGNRIGHGRIELLEHIGTHGSIAKAAKAMDMSYKRAWYLIDEFSGCFSKPLIERQHGGKGGGSAQLTDFGREVVERYRRMEFLARRSMKDEIVALEQNLANKKSKKSAKSA